MDGGDRANQHTGEVEPRPEFNHGLTTVRIGKSSARAFSLSRSTIEEAFKRAAEIDADNITVEIAPNGTIVLNAAVRSAPG